MSTPAFHYLCHAYLHQFLSDITVLQSLCKEHSEAGSEDRMLEVEREGRVLCQPNQWKLLLISDPGQRNEQTNSERGRWQNQMWARHETRKRNFWGHCWVWLIWNVKIGNRNSGQSQTVRHWARGVREEKLKADILSGINICQVNIAHRGHWHEQTQLPGVEEAVTT